MGSNNARLTHIRQPQTHPHNEEPERDPWDWSQKRNIFYDLIFLYDPSKFEFESPFSDFVIFLDIRIFLLLCTKPPSSVQTVRGYFLIFSSGLEETLLMKLITKKKIKKKICSRIRFFDMISQILNSSLFAIFKLIERPLPSKRHGKFPEFFLRVREHPYDEIDQKNMSYDSILLIWYLKVSYSSPFYYLSLVNSNVQCPISG